MSQTGKGSLGVCRRICNDSPVSFLLCWTGRISYYRCNCGSFGALIGVCAFQNLLSDRRRQFSGIRRISLLHQTPGLCMFHRPEKKTHGADSHDKRRNRVCFLDVFRPDYPAVRLKEALMNTLFRSIILLIIFISIAVLPLAAEGSAEEISNP